jgi:dolichyl-diphosphooligosaccharide--protein glycosyltransferase
MFVWICSGLCLATGALTRTDIVHTVLLVPPVMAAIMIPVVFVLIRKISDLKTGLLGAGLAAVIGGNYFNVSLAGNFDHHMADVFNAVFACATFTRIWYKSQVSATIQYKRAVLSLLSE